MIKKEKKILIIFCIILILLIGYFFWYKFIPTTFCKNYNNLSKQEVLIDVKNGSNGMNFTIHNEKDVQLIIDILSNRKYYKTGISIGNKENYYTLTFYDGCKILDKFVINNENCIQKDLFFYSCKEDNNELIDLLLQLENNIDLINGNNLETFVDSQVETISYYDFENNKEIVINDFNSIHNFFDIISLGELEQLEQMPEQYFKMLVSSTMPYPNSYTFIIKTNNNNYSMCFIDEYFSFAGNYYKTNNISQKLLTIFNNSYKSDVNVYNLDFNVLNISTSNIDFEVINNGNNTIYYEEQFELQEYLNGEWIELKPIKDINWNNDIFIIKPQKATNIKCNFTNIYGELKQNTKYRICKTFGIYGNDEELGLNYIYFKTN